MWIPGFGSEEIRPYKKACTTEAHKQVRSLGQPGLGPRTAPRSTHSCLLERLSPARPASLHQRSEATQPQLPSGCAVASELSVFLPGLLGGTESSWFQIFCDCAHLLPHLSVSQFQYHTPPRSEEDVCWAPAQRYPGYSA